MHKHGNVLIITEVPSDWDHMFKALTQFSDDFMLDGRSDILPEDREGF